MRVRDFFPRPDCYTTALAADIFTRGRWTDSERTAMFGHVARQSASIYDDSRAGRLISLRAAKMDTPVSWTVNRFENRAVSVQEVWVDYSAFPIIILSRIKKIS